MAVPGSSGARSGSPARTPPLPRGPTPMDDTRSSSGLLSLPPDCVARCLSGARTRDLVSVALASKDLRQAAYSDEVWEPKWRMRWPSLPFPSDARQAQSAREAFLERQHSTATLAFSDFHSAQCELGRQEDTEERHDAGQRNRGRDRAQTAPLDRIISLDSSAPPDVPPESYLFAAVQGSDVSVWRALRNGPLHRSHSYTDHSGKVTGIMSFQVPEGSPLYRNAMERGPEEYGLWDDESSRSRIAVLTCSRDRTIKLWGRPSKPLRTFSGHTADVLCLSDRLLEEPCGPASLSPFATGSLDCTVRVWSLAPPGKGRSPLLATLIGHVAPVSQLAVPRSKHVSSSNWLLEALLRLLCPFSRHADGELGLISADKTGKVQFWDKTLASSLRRGVQASCVGAARGPTNPIALQACRHLCFAVSEKRVAAFDMRSLQQVFTVETRGALALTTFKASVESGEHLWCGANTGDVFFCDMRRLPQDLSPSQENGGPVSFLELDSFKAVTGSTESPHVQVWDPCSGEHLHTHTLFDKAEAVAPTALSAMACSGSALMFAVVGRESSWMECRQFEEAVVPLEEEGCTVGGRFWDSTALPQYTSTQ